MRGDRLNIWAVAVSAVLLFAAAVGAEAQETTGTITGLVTDQTGAILPGTSVAVKHVATGRTQEIIANESGRYVAALLQPGTYEVTFTLSGFQPVVVRGIPTTTRKPLPVCQCVKWGETGS